MKEQTNKSMNESINEWGALELGQDFPSIFQSKQSWNLHSEA